MTLPNEDTVYFPTDDAVPANDSKTYDLEARGAKRLVGSVKLANTYDVVIQYFDPSFDNKVNEKTIASDVPGGNRTTIDERVDSPFARLKIVNDGGTDDTPDGNAYLR